MALLCGKSPSFSHETGTSVPLRVALSDTRTQDPGLSGRQSPALSGLRPISLVHTALLSERPLGPATRIVLGLSTRLQVLGGSALS